MNFIFFLEGGRQHISLLQGISCRSIDRSLPRTDVENGKFYFTYNRFVFDSDLQNFIGTNALIFPGEWKLSQQRKFLDDFAKSRQFDPLDPENWYLVEKKDIMQAVSIAHISLCEKLKFCTDIM